MKDGKGVKRYGGVVNGDMVGCLVEGGKAEEGQRVMVGIDRVDGMGWDGMGG